MNLIFEDETPSFSKIRPDPLRRHTGGQAVSTVYEGAIGQAFVHAVVLSPAARSPLTGQSLPSGDYSSAEQSSLFS